MTAESIFRRGTADRRERFARSIMEAVRDPLAALLSLFALIAVASGARAAEDDDWVGAFFPYRKFDALPARASKWAVARSKSHSHPARSIFRMRRFSTGSHAACARCAATSDACRIRIRDC